MNITTIKQVEVSTTIGTAPQLPQTVAVEFDNGIQTDLAVSWNQLISEHYQQEGTYSIEGEIQLQEYPNPLVEQRADPYIYKHTDGYYYFTGSYPEYDRIVLRRAQSIKDLSTAEETVIWHKPDTGIMSKHIWAPELHFIDGKWYVHYAAGDTDDVWAIRPYVLECSADNPLQGEWVEKGQVNTDFQSFSLDATTFENKGTRYLVWAQKVDNDTVSNLFIAEMTNPWTIKGGQTVISTPDLEWEQQGFYVNEGAAVIKRNGKVFITYSASATDDRYVMGLLTASEDSDLVDPASWTKSLEPIFATNEETKEYGPGHNSFTVAEDGITDLLVYHARPYKEIEEGNSLYDHNRHARVQQLFWNQQGNPYLGSPGQIIDTSKQKVIATITVQ